MANITLKGNATHTEGELPKVGAKTPDFKLTRADLEDASLESSWTRKFKAAYALVLACAVLASFAVGCSSSGNPPVHDGRGGATALAKPFVLVHGAFMGAWGWSSVAAGLRAQGAKVTVVELPAHGADTTPLSGATFDAYVAKVGSAIEATGDSVVLVGHSMGGMVITSVAEQMPDKIAKLVYLAGFVPKDGDILKTLATQDTGSHLVQALTIDQTNGVAKLPTEKLQDIFCADCPAPAAAELTSHHRDEPLAPFATPVHTTAANWGRVPRYYIYTKLDNALTYTWQQSMTAGVTFRETATLDTGHAPFLSHPDAVVKALLGF
jgi:pimeloyl-ACP methyl ester carboxylesterase